MDYNGIILDINIDKELTQYTEVDKPYYSGRLHMYNRYNGKRSSSKFTRKRHSNSKHL